MLSDIDHWWIKCNFFVQYLQNCYVHNCETACISGYSSKNTNWATAIIFHSSVSKPLSWVGSTGQFWYINLPKCMPLDCHGKCVRHQRTWKCTRSRAGSNIHPWKVQALSQSSSETFWPYLYLTHKGISIFLLHSKVFLQKWIKNRVVIVHISNHYGHSCCWNLR